MLLRRINDKRAGGRFDLCQNVWTILDDDAPVPEEGSVLLSLAQWLEKKESLAQRRDGTGVWIAADGDVESLGKHCVGLALISLQFPRFQDGRAYSQARLLRERYGFRGELRASGKVLRDQLAFMERCGFDSFEVDERITLPDFVQALGEISVWYQPTGDNRITACQLRMSKKISSTAPVKARGAM